MDTALESKLKNIVTNLPESPGSYQYLDETGKIIYVGKAKNLKRRVSSYFNKDQQSQKTKLLVSKIRDIHYIVVKTEEDALLLENNLIKQHKPKYNILLKDGKTYPSIAVTKEFLPRIFKTRNRNLKHALLFGPYSHAGTMYALLDLCKELYQVRPCMTPMTKEGVENGKYDVCLRYHLHKCKAPCCGRQTHEEYVANIGQCIEILKGNTAELSRNLRKKMETLSEELRFEEAEEIRKKYEIIENFRSKSTVISSVEHNIDVFNIDSDEKAAYVNYLHVVKGSITQAYTLECKKKLDESNKEIIAYAIIELREKFASNSKEIVVPFRVDIPESIAIQTIPQRGDKYHLLELSALNVKQYKFDKLKQAEKLNPEQKSVRLMKEIQKDLGLSSLPYRIELFDNSNISGEDAVAACVVFEKLKPAKKEYRTYNIKTVTGPDDYASMKEVVRRRYSRIIEELSSLPDLIIADGGKGQMEVIREVTEDELKLNIPIAGLAKDKRHRTRELLFGFPQKSIGVDPSSQLFRTLTQMQDEVHRFAIKFHRNKRSKRQVASELDKIDGIGKKTKELLLKKFGSVKVIKNADETALQKILGPIKGSKIYHNLHKGDISSEKINDI